MEGLKKIPVLLQRALVAGVELILDNDITSTALSCRGDRLTTTRGKLAFILMMNWSMFRRTTAGNRPQMCVCARACACASTANDVPCGLSGWQQLLLSDSESLSINIHFQISPPSFSLALPHFLSLATSNFQTISHTDPDARLPVYFPQR